MPPTESPSSVSKIDAAVAQFEDAWQRGQRPAIETYLNDSDADRELLRRELIHVELERRIKAHQKVAADEYWQQFQELQSPVEAGELLCTELEARKQLGDSIDRTDVLRRLASVDNEFASSWNEDTSIQAKTVADLKQKHPHYAELFRLLESVSDLETSPHGSFESTTGVEHDPNSITATTSAGGEVPGYELIERIGGGGMGVVYKARQLNPKRLVAIKLILSDLRISAEAVERFRREASAVASLEHEGIVRLYEFGEAGGQPYFSMQLVEGQTLAKHCRETSMQPRDIATTMKALAAAVDYAHRHGVVHRDLKPSNVLLDEDNRPMIADFGLAKNLNDEQADLTNTGMALGTYAYMAPEQAGPEKVDLSVSVDVYGLGAIMYELLTGRPPFRGESPAHTLNNVLHVEPEPPSRVAPGASRELEAVCLKCLEKRPAARYADAAELADDLQRFLDHRPLRAKSPTLATRAWKWTRRRPAVAAIVGILALSAAALLVTGSIYQAQLAFAVGEYQRKDRDLTASLIDNYVQNAALFGQQGNWDRSVEELDKALGLDPPNEVAIRLQKVKAYNAMYEGGEAQAEITLLKEEVTSGEHVGEVMLWYGDLMLLEANQAEALRHVREALEHGLPPADAAYAESLLAESSPEAEQHLLRALEEDPFHYRAYANLISLNVFQGKREEARHRAESARHIFPNDPMFPMTMAWIAAMEGDLEQANEYLELLDGKIANSKLSILSDTFDMLQPIASWTDNWDSGASVTETLGLVGKLWLNIQRYQLEEKGVGGYALSFFSSDSTVLTSLRTPPCISNTYSALAGNLFRMRLLASSHTVARERVKAIDRAVEKHPEGTLYFTKGVILTSIGEWEDAQEAFKRATVLPSILPNVAREAELGAAMSAAARFAIVGEKDSLPSAVEAVRRRIQLGILRPTHAGYCLQIVNLANDYELAHAIIAAQLAQNPEDLVWLRHYAANELARGNIASAIEKSRYLLDNDPYDEVAKKIEADALAKARELIEAEAEEKEPTEPESEDNQEQTTPDDDDSNASIDAKSE